MFLRVEGEKTEEQFEKSYEKLNRKTRQISTQCAVTVIWLEYVTVFYKIFKGDITNWRELFEYLTYYMIGTMILIGICYSIIAIIEKVFELNNAEALNPHRFKLKQVTSLGRIAIVTWIVPLVHCQYPCVYVAPMAVIMASAVYADLGILRVTAFNSVISLIVSLTINGVFRRDQLPNEYMMHCIIAISILLVSYMIAKQLTLVEVHKEKEQLDIKEMERTDPLTGIWNRRRLGEITDKCNDSMVIAMIDIDKFKEVNDTYGHPFGDSVLKRLASMLKDAESLDIKSFRYGGEEFTLVFKGEYSNEKVNSMLNSLRKRFSEQIYEKHPELKVTISIGFANSRDFTGYSAEELIIKADEALYKAKNAGRNKVVRAEKENKL